MNAPRCGEKQACVRGAHRQLLALTNQRAHKEERAWVDFIKEDKNYTKFSPSTAGVPGAPDLANFEARVATAPVKP